MCVYVWNYKQRKNTFVGKTESHILDSVYIV